MKFMKYKNNTSNSASAVCISFYSAFVMFILQIICVLCCIILCQGLCQYCCFCVLVAPFYQNKFVVCANIIGNKALSVSDQMESKEKTKEFILIELVFRLLVCKAGLALSLYLFFINICILHYFDIFKHPLKMENVHYIMNLFN